MNRKRWIQLSLITVLTLGVGVGIGYWCARKTSAPAAADESATGADKGPEAEVKTIPLKRDQIKSVLVAYGTVMAAPSETRTFSVSYECRVKTILVTAGQVIQTNTPLIEVEPSPETRLQLDQARNERDAAKRTLQLVQQRFDLKLVTRQDQLQAQQQFDSAELKVRSLESRGVENSQILRADAPGVVSDIAVQPGQIVAAGAPLLNTIGENQIIVRLGIGNEEASRVQAGQPVELRSVNAPETQTTPGNIRLVASRINPQTRLLDVYVTPDPAAHFLLNEYVQGKIVVAAHEAWVVPHAAVLPVEGHQILYTVEAGKAVQQIVTTGLENDQQVEVIGENLKADVPVVVVGNSQLQSGMAVHEGAKP
jgi:RND family efflux transporter MFP subunit